MKIPEWIKDTLMKWVPDLVVEFLGVQSIKKLLSKGKEKADETAMKSETAKTEGAETKEPEVKHEGLFNLSDEEAYLRLMGELERKDAVKISSFLEKYLEPWQQRRFRASVGNLGKVKIPPTSKWETVKKSDTVKEYSLRRGDAKAGKDSRTEYEQKEMTSGGETIDLGVKFLKSFAQCSPNQMFDICKAAGIIHSDFDGIKQTWKKLNAWLEEDGKKNSNAIKKLNKEISKQIAAMPKYEGHLVGIFGKTIGGFLQKTFVS